MSRAACILFLFWLSAGVIFAQNTALAAQDAPVALTGTLITPNGIVQDGTVLIENGSIAAVGTNVPLPPGTMVIATHEVIAPGLIDLHNHLTWNVFPRWKPAEKFGNRYDWRASPVYEQLMVTPHGALVKAGLECQMERYAEVKAITEGETSVVGGMTAACDQGLARNLDYDPELGTGLGKVLYDIFPLTMNEKNLADDNTVLAGQPQGFLILHLAEGESKNASAAEEFYMLEGRGLLRPGVSVVHGVALTPQNFAVMGKAGVGLIWSPRSNIELYGDTTNVAAAKAAGVRIAIAPDWSPTGSVGLLEELNYVSSWNRRQPAPIFTDSELVSMATSNAAALVGLGDQIGSLAPNHAADLLVVSDIGKTAGKDAYWSLTHAKPQDVHLVMIGGRATYGDPKLMQQLSKGQNETLTICAKEKTISFASEIQAQGSFAAMEATLDQALRQQGSYLAPLAECRK